MKYILPYVVVLASIFLASPLIAQGGCPNGTSAISSWKFAANTLYQLTGSSNDLESQIQFSNGGFNLIYFALSAAASTSSNNRIGVDTQNSPAVIWNDDYLASSGAACLYLGNSSTFTVEGFQRVSGGNVSEPVCQSQSAGINTMQVIAQGTTQNAPEGNGIRVNIQAVTDEADICEFIADGNCNMFGTTPPSSCVAYFATTCGDKAHCGGNKECCAFEWKSTLAERLGITASSYSWDFGDGNTSTYSSPMHKYKNPKQYQVTLKIKDSKGNSYTSTETMFTED